MIQSSILTFELFMHVDYYVCLLGTPLRQLTGHNFLFMSLHVIHNTVKGTAIIVLIMFTGRPACVQLLYCLFPRHIAINTHTHTHTNYIISPTNVVSMMVESHVKIT